MVLNGSITRKADKHPPPHYWLIYEMASTINIPILELLTYIRTHNITAVLTEYIVTQNAE